MERKLDYSTTAHNGMEWLPGTGWRYTGPKGYRVQFTGGEGDKCWSVFSYAGAHTRLCYPYANLTEDDAHERAASLARTTPHPKPGAPVTLGGVLVCSECGDRVADGDAGREGQSKGAPCLWVDCTGVYRDA